MITLTLDNSYSRIEGLSSQQYLELRELLSYKIDASIAYHSGYRQNKRYLLGKKGDFPSGLLYLVDSYLKNTKIRLIDKRIQPKPTPGMFKMRDLGFTPRQRQVAAALTAKAEGQGTIVAPTAYGKSIMMALTINQVQVKTLIVVPTVGLREQLRDSFNRFFEDSSNVVIENIDSPKLKYLTDFDCLIVDESHHVAAKTYRQLNKKAWNNIYYRFFFTATPFRSRDEEQLLFESIAGPVIYRITYQEALEEKAVMPIEAYFYDVPPKEMEGHEGYWKAVYSELVVNHAARNDLILDLIHTLNANNLSTLVLVKEIQHGNILSDGTFTFVSGEKENNQENIALFNNKQITMLIGTTGVLGEGIDTRPAEYIILAGGGKSKNQLMQNIGRGLRPYKDKESCKVILFRDKSNKYLLRHFNACIRVLKEEYGIKPVKLELIEE